MRHFARDRDRGEVNTDTAIVAGVVHDASWAGPALDVWTSRLEEAGAIAPRLWVEGQDVRFVFEAAGESGPGGDAGRLLDEALSDNLDDHTVKFWFANHREDIEDPYPDR
jgi:hypothetical protein